MILLGKLTAVSPGGLALVVWHGAFWARRPFGKLTNHAETVPYVSTTASPRHPAPTAVCWNLVRPYRGRGNRRNRFTFVQRIIRLHHPYNMISEQGQTMTFPQTQVQSTHTMVENGRAAKRGLPRPQKPRLAFLNILTNRGQSNEPAHFHLSLHQRRRHRQKTARNP